MFNHQRHALPIFVIAAFGTFHLAINIFIPALPSVAEAFQANEDIVQLSIAVFLIGSAISSLVYGVLSDQIGRKPILMIGLGIFAVTSLLCIFAPSIETLIILRTCQGLGAGSISVTCFSMIQEQYSLKQATRITNTMGIIREFVIAFAPIIGGYLVVIGGWRSTFILVTLFLLSILYYGQRWLRETSQLHEERTITFRPVLRHYHHVCKNPQFIRYVIIFPFLLCGLWSYFTVLPFYFITTLHIPTYLFGYYIAPAAVMYSLGSIIANKIIHKYDLNATIKVGLILCLGAGIGQLILHFTFPGNPLMIVIIQSFYVMGMAFAFAPSISKAIEPFHKNRGVANSLGGMLRQSFAGLGALAGGYFDDTSLLSVALFLIFLTTVAFLIFTFWNPSDKENTENVHTKKDK